jgi:DNA-binding GntR family transcriptional regulator
MFCSERHISVNDFNDIADRAEGVRSPGTSKLTRVNDAYGRLKSDILENRLPPGLMVPEPEIAHRLGMSRTPVREALITLQSEGLVELIPRRGVRILPISPKDMCEIYELLTLLEPEAAADLAEQTENGGTIAALEDSTAEMEQALRENDLDRWAKADDAFHRELLRAKGNRRLLVFVSNLFDQAHRARMVTLRLRALPWQSTEEHRAILTAISNGNADEARAIFRLHRERAADELLGVLEKSRLSNL